MEDHTWWTLYHSFLTGSVCIALHTICNECFHKNDNKSRLTLTPPRELGSTELGDALRDSASAACHEGA